MWPNSTIPNYDFLKISTICFELLTVQAVLVKSFDFSFTYIHNNDVGGGCFFYSNNEFFPIPLSQHIKN